MVTDVALPGVPAEHFRFFITVKSGPARLYPTDTQEGAFEECGVFNEALRTTQDYDLWFKMAEKYNFIHIPRKLVKARQHAGQGSVRTRDTALAEINSLLSNLWLT